MAFSLENQMGQSTLPRSPTGVGTREYIKRRLKTSVVFIGVFLTYAAAVAHGEDRSTRWLPGECVPISDVIDRWVVRADESRFSEVELDESGFGFDDSHRGAWCAMGCRFFVNSAGMVKWYSLQGSKLWRQKSPMRDPAGERSFYERLIFRLKNGKRIELTF